MPCPPGPSVHAADGLSLSAPQVVLKTQSTTYLTVKVWIEDPTAEWVNVQALGPGSGYQSDILLKRFNPDAYSSSVFAPYSKRAVKFYFRPAGAATWSYKGATTTNAKGAFPKCLKAAKTGSWQARFVGVPAYAPSSGSATTVKVK